MLNTAILRCWPSHAVRCTGIQNLPRRWLGPSSSLGHRQITTTMPLRSDGHRFQKPPSSTMSKSLDRVNRKKQSLDDREKFLWHQVRVVTQSRSYQDEGQKSRALSRLYAQIEHQQIMKKIGKILHEEFTAIDSGEVYKKDMAWMGDRMFMALDLLFNAVSATWKYMPLWILAPIGEVGIGRRFRVIFVGLWRTFIFLPAAPLWMVLRVRHWRRNAKQHA